MSASLRQGARRHSVESILERIGSLALQRQELRARAVNAAALERNRAELVEAQWQLSYALIERHLPAPARTAA